MFQAKRIQRLKNVIYLSTKTCPLLINELGFEWSNRSFPQAFVQEVLQLIELDETKDALVGVPGISGISNEQRKRLTIAVELVSNPSIIFMDEPTSGLDARAAAIVMRVVRNIVLTQRTVVCTIHQPSIDIFEAFDEVRKLTSQHELGSCNAYLMQFINGTFCSLFY